MLSLKAFVISAVSDSERFHFINSFLYLSVFIPVFCVVSYDLLYSVPVEFNSLNFPKIHLSTVLNLRLFCLAESF